MREVWGMKSKWQRIGPQNWKLPGWKQPLGKCSLPLSLAGSCLWVWWDHVLRAQHSPDLEGAKHRARQGLGVQHSRRSPASQLNEIKATELQLPASTLINQNFWKAHFLPEMCYLLKNQQDIFHQKTALADFSVILAPDKLQHSSTTAFQPNNPTKNCTIRILNALGTELIPDGIQQYSSL